MLFQFDLEEYSSSPWEAVFTRKDVTGSDTFSISNSLCAERALDKILKTFNETFTVGSP